MYWRINLCLQLITVSSSVLVLKTDYTCKICLRFEHGLSRNYSPNTLFIFSFHFYYLHSTLHSLTFFIAYYLRGITSVLT